MEDCPRSGRKQACIAGDRVKHKRGWTLNDMRHHNVRSLATRLLFRCRGLDRLGPGWSGVSRCEHAIRHKAHHGVNAKKHEKRNPEILDDGLAHTRPAAISTSGCRTRTPCA